VPVILRRWIDAPVVIGLGAGLVYWLLESSIHVVLEPEGFLRHLLPTDLHEWWTRLLVLGLCLSVGIGVSALQGERLRTRQAARRAQARAQREERGRLARDLHDAVAQSLFSISLIAESLPGVWEKDSREGRRHLEKLRLLVREALAETRGLLLELRPESLATVELGELLQELGRTFEYRDHLHVDVDLDVNGGVAVPLEQKIAFYRIASEALTNVSKHSGAVDARLCLLRSRERVELKVTDSGRGFRPAEVPPTSLGLRIMRERADEASIRLDVRSRPGGGTRVSAVWQSPRALSVTV
jgi:signal transduction histidine kinase